jgi:hypothetical protein
LINPLACEPHGPEQDRLSPLSKSSMHRRRHVQHVPKSHTPYPLLWPRGIYPSTQHATLSSRPSQVVLRLTNNTCMLYYIQKHPVLTYSIPDEAPPCAHPMSTCQSWWPPGGARRISSLASPSQDDGLISSEPQQTDPR